MTEPLLYRAALQGIFGKRTEFSRSSITDALFVYLDGEPEPESVAEVDARFRARPLVCLTKAWEEVIETQYPDADVFRRTVMKPARRFVIPANTAMPEGYGMEDLVFHSSAPDIVRVSQSGEITGMHAGACYILVETGDKNYRVFCHVMVTDPVR